MTRFIAVVSGKGGTGKTVTAINLGVGLTNLGKHAIVVDGNITTPHIGLSLGKAHPEVDLHDVLSGKYEIHDSIYVHPSGVKIIPADISVEQANNANIDNLSSVLYKLVGKADVVIIDSAPGLGEISRSILAAADEVLIVTNPELHALTDALRTIHFARHNNAKVLGAVLARVRNDKYELDNESVESMLGVKILAVIPEDEAVRHAAKLSHPVMYSHPNASASLGYKILAAKLLGTKYEVLEKKEKIKKPFFEAIRKRFGLY